MRHSDDMGGSLRSFYPVHGAVDCCSGEQRGVLADGRQLHIAEPGELTVVVAEYRNVFRDFQPVCPKALDHAECRPVIERDDGSRQIVSEGSGGSQPVFLGGAARDNHSLQPAALHFSAEGFPALVGGDGCSAIDMNNFAVAQPVRWSTPKRMPA